MYIAIDVGGTNARVGGSGDNINLERVQKFPVSHQFENDFQKISEIIDSISGGKVEAIGIGTPGNYTADKKNLLPGGNLPEWVGKPFVHDFSERFHCPVFADNDAVVASLAEVFFGLRQNTDFIYLTWGTGIGGAVVEKNVPQKIEWKKYLKPLEGKCSGRSMRGRFGKEASQLDDGEWDEIMKDFELNLPEISDRLEQKIIVLGGGAATKQKERLRRVARKLSEKGIKLYLSDLDDDVGLYGGLGLIKLKLNR